MKHITNSKKCTGCQACRSLCPVQCIGITENDEGFQFPHIDEARCINCNLCVSRCPENNRPEYREKDLVRVFGARLKDNRLLLKSASGGVFVGVAAKILETPGNAVFGCAYDDEMVARHVCVTNFSEIGPLQSSKYVQSDVGDTYSQAKTLLDRGKTVLYTGTPCQVAGLYALLGRDYDNLLTTELICHGVPSPLLFRRYIDWLGKKYRGRVVSHSFRDKERDGWGLMTGIKVQTRTGTKTRGIEPQIDPYLYTFYHKHTFRESCYTCQYANPHRIADITLGDYWGVRKFDTGFFDSRGVSIVLVNSEKGERFFEAASGGFEIIETTLENASAENQNLCMPSDRPAVRDIIYQNMKDETANIFKSTLFKTNAKLEIKYTIKQSIPLAFLKFYRSCKAVIKGKAH